jgi:hypothetical protein
MRTVQFVALSSLPRTSLHPRNFTTMHFSSSVCFVLEVINYLHTWSLVCPNSGILFLGLQIFTQDYDHEIIILSHKQSTEGNED